jgi:hypothetical protein
MSDVKESRTFSHMLMAGNCRKRQKKLIWIAERDVTLADIAIY